MRTAGIGLTGWLGINYLLSKPSGAGSSEIPITYRGGHIRVDPISGDQTVEVSYNQDEIEDTVTLITYLTPIVIVFLIIIIILIRKFK